jgi:hypothetical protein
VDRNRFRIAASEFESIAPIRCSGTLAALPHSRVSVGFARWATVLFARQSIESRLDRLTMHAGFTFTDHTPFTVSSRIGSGYSPTGLAPLSAA